MVKEDCAPPCVLIRFAVTQYFSGIANKKQRSTAVVVYRLWFPGEGVRFGSNEVRCCRCRFGCYLYYVLLALDAAFSFLLRMRSSDFQKR